MIKFSLNTDFNFDCESVTLVTDKKHLTKKAAAKTLKFEKTAGQTDLHVIALGSLEKYGYNRNGDGFRAEDCEKYHNRFVKAGRAINRNHKNKKTDPKYGNIKAAAYNDDMGRVELIIGLDNDKCSDILHKVAEGKPTHWSMASRQPHDVCSWCMHKAASDDDRCDDIPYKLGEINDEGIMCGMINPNPGWFELSHVGRPADRLGTTLKLASDSNMKPMLPRDYLKIYEGFEVPKGEIFLSKKASEKRSLIHKLSEMEKHIDAVATKAIPDTAKDMYLKKDAPKAAKVSMDDKTIDSLRNQDPEKVLKTLADHGIVFSPEDFSKYLFNDRVKGEDVDKMKSCLPHGFSNLEDSDDEGEVVNSDSFEPSSLGGIPPEVKSIIEKMMGDSSMFGGPAHKRVIRITIMGGKAPSLEPKQEMSKESFAKELAKQYLSYKLAALNYIDEQGKLDDDLLWNVVLQNRI